MAKITDDQLQKINFLKKEAVELASALGEIEYQKTLLETQKDNIKTQIKALRKDEETIFAELREAYGNISVNLDNGEYTVMQ